MSTTIDNKVVEMRFDNRQFESNVQTSLSTIDKLKQSLNFDKSAKGLESINAASRNVNMTGLGSAIDTIHAKFSALEIMGVTALANITNSAVNTGKRMVSALSVEPIMSGFQEYETQMGAIQTILANTQKEGTNVAKVNAALDELNLYADKTIYNFTEMTRNIGTFTAAGVKLNDSVQSIKGIANLAAVSGSTSQQASVAMYQLSQALASGTVKLMDWNSVVNAGMGGQVFQEALKRTSELLGTGAEAAIKAKGSFRESLKDGWLTTEVLSETLKQISGAYTEAELRAQGYTEEQAKEIAQLADTAVAAATEVKTFTQLWDTLKEAAQSGWSQTWRLIIGDFEKAKERMTELSNIFGEIIGKSSDRRNNLLEGVLSSKWDSILNKVNAAGIETEVFQDKIKELAKNHNVDLDSMIEKEGSFEKALLKAFSGGKLKKSILSDAIKSFVGNLTGATKSTEKMAKSVEQYGEIVDKVINGDFGNGADRIKKLTEAGYDYATVQNLVNEKLGNSVRHMSSLTEEQLKYADSSSKMTDEQLKSKGYTEEQIKALRDLAAEADKADSSISKLITGFEKPSGAELIWDSIINVIYAIKAPLEAIGDAWNTFFTPDPTAIYKMLEAINEFTKKLRSLAENKDTIDKITRSFKGLFALLDIITTITGGGLKIGLKLICKLLGMADVDVLDLTASLGDLIVQFHDWLFENNKFAKGVETAINSIDGAITAVKEWVNAFLKIPKVQKIIEKLATSLGDFKTIGGNIITGLQKGLEEKIESIPEIMTELGKKIIDAICKVLRIESPSKEMIKVGEYIIEGLVKGISSGVGGLLSGISTIGEWIINAFKEIKWGEITGTFGESFSKFTEILGKFDYSKLLAIIPIGVVLVFVKQIYGVAKTLSNGINSINEVIDNFALIEQKFAKVLNSFALRIKADALFKISKALVMLIGAVIALTFVDTTKLYSAVGVVVVLAVVLGVLAGAVDKISKASVSFEKKKGFKINGLAIGIISIAASLLLMSKAMKNFASLSPSEFNQASTAIIGCVAALITIIGAYALFEKYGSINNVSKIGGLLIGVSVSLLIMVGVCKLAGQLTEAELKQGAIFVAAFTAFIFLLTKSISVKDGIKIAEISGLLWSVSFCLILMVGVCKLASRLNESEMEKGGVFALAFAGFIWVLKKAVSMKDGTKIAALSGLLLSVSISLILMVGVCKLVGKLEPKEMIKGGAFALAFIGLIGVLKKITTIGSDKQMAKVAGTILAMSIALGVMAGVAILLSMMPLDGLKKGVGAVAILGLVMAAMIKATQGANNVMANLIVMTVAIAIMAGAVTLLSTIDGDKLTGATAALSILMGMFALMEKCSKDAIGSAKTLLVMTLVVGLLSGILYLLSGLPVESTLAVSASLSLLLLSLSTSLVIVSKVNSVAPQALIAMGIMTLVVAGLAVILGVLAKCNVGPTLEIAKSLSLLLIALSGACVILGVVGLMGPAAYIGIGTLVTLIASVGALMVAIGALTDYFPRMEEFLDKGLPILEKIGHGIGSFFGNIISGFAEGLTDGLPGIAENLSNFMTNLQPFIDGSKNIDAESVKGIEELVKVIALISGASIIESVASWLTGSSSMETFAKQLDAFGKAIVGFSNTVKGNVDESAVAAAASAGALMAELQSKVVPVGGVFQFFAGSKDLASFGAQLVIFGKAIVNFSNTVSEGINQEAVMAAATAGVIMTTLQSKIVPTGGVVQWFVGNKDLGVFGKQIKKFGEAMVDFSKTVSGNIDEGAVIAAANAGKIMATVQSAIPENKWLDGKISLKTFGKHIVKFGEYIADFSDEVTRIDTSAVTTSVSVARQLANFTRSIAELDLNPLNKFKIKDLGTNLKEYSDKVVKVDNVAVTKSLSTANGIIEFINGISTINMSGVDLFNSAVKSLSKVDMSEFAKTFTSSSSDLSSAGSTMINSLIKGVSSKQSSLTSAASSLITNMYREIVDRASLFSSAGIMLISRLEQGILSRRSFVISSVSSAVSAAAVSVKSYYNSFYSSGAYIGEGLVQGIKSKYQAIYNAGFAGGNKGAVGAKAGARVNSPSKITIKVGEGIGEGLILGINSMTSDVYVSGQKLGKNAADSVSSAISKIPDLLNSDVNLQPSIRPVLDLSEVQSGVSAIDGLFGTKQSVGVMTNLNAISASMNSRSQNGGFSDVVSSIDKLRKDLGNIGGTTYNVNGITYDDGSNVADAVRTLTRAARIERRI